jgi:hypothetical protein
LKEERFLNLDNERSHEKYLEDLKQMCSKKYKTVELLDFEMVQSPWCPEEICKYLLEHTTYLSK